MNTLNMDAHYARQIEERQEEETMDRMDRLLMSEDAEAVRIEVQYSTDSTGSGAFCAVVRWDTRVTNYYAATARGAVMYALRDVEEEMAQIEEDEAEEDEAEDAYWQDKIIVPGGPES